jgi:uncharacterized membrane protein YadS
MADSTPSTATAANPTFAAVKPHFVIRFLNLIIMDSFSHFLTIPDEASNSERVIRNVAACG